MEFLCGFWRRALTELQYADVRKVPVPFVVIEPVADHEFVRDREPGVVGPDIGDTAFGFVEQHNDAQMLWFSFLEQSQKVFKRQSGIKNIFNYDDGPAFDAHVQILNEFDLASGADSFAIAGDGHEVEGDFPAQLASQIRKKQNRTFQDGHKVQGVLRKVPADFARELADALLDAGASDKNAYQLARSAAGLGPLRSALPRFGHCFRSCLVWLLNPVGDEDIRFVRHPAVAVGGPGETSAVGGEHGESVEIGVIGDALRSRVHW